MATIAPYGVYQAFDDNGDPLAGGFLYTYEAGTSTPKATYMDSSGAPISQNTNPVELDASGMANVWLGDGGYKFILKDANLNTIFTVDNIGGTNDTAFGASVNAISTNTVINVTYANSVNICTGSPTLSLLTNASAGEGFYFSVKNQGSGVVTLDPDGGETIDGQSTKSIGPNQSALIISNGTQWYTLFYYTVSTEGNNIFTGNNTFSGNVLFPSDGTLTIATGVITVTGADHLVDTEGAASTDDLVTINGGSDGQILILSTVDSARDVVIKTTGNIATGGGDIALGANTTKIVMQYNAALTKWLILSATVAQGLKADTAIQPSTATGLIGGLNLSNNVTDANNDIDVALGSCVNSTYVDTIYLPASITKRLDAAWSVGTNQGGLDTGSKANSTWYHVYVIKRIDTGVVDALFSTSVSSPTLPTNYTEFRRIGAVRTDGSGNLLPFFQWGKRFVLKTPILDVNINNEPSTEVIRTLTVPLGVKVNALFNMYQSSAGVTTIVYVSDPDQVDLAPSQTIAPLMTMSNANAGALNGAQVQCTTNTSSQIRTRHTNGSGTNAFRIATYGWEEIF